MQPWLRLLRRQRAPPDSSGSFHHDRTDHLGMDRADEAVRAGLVELVRERLIGIHRARAKQAGVARDAVWLVIAVAPCHHRTGCNGERSRLKHEVLDQHARAVGRGGIGGFRAGGKPKERRCDRDSRDPEGTVGTHVNALRTSMSSLPVPNRASLIVPAIVTSSSAKLCGCLTTETLVT